MIRANLCRNARTVVVCLINTLMIVGPIAPTAVVNASTRTSSRKPLKVALPVPAAPATLALPRPVPAPAPFAVNITATKVDSYANAPNPALPGDTIDYTVTITNNGSTDATGVVFNDNIDPNTTLVPGTVQTQPLAAPDTYNVIGNVRIQPIAANGLLANDIDPDTGNNTGLTASGPAVTTQGGNLTINADGSFTYNPAPGFAGTDTFTYTVTDTTSKTDTALVTLNVGNGTATPGTNVVWFINPAAPVGGDGRLTNPFNCYTGANSGAQTCFSATAADDPGDAIFLFSGAHVGGNALLNNQKLIGAGASATLASLAGLTVPTGSDALPSTGGASPTITTSVAATNAIPLGQGNLLRGFTVGNTTGAKIFGNNFGTLVVGNSASPDVVLNGSGQALNLTTGTLSTAGGFSSVATTSSSTQGISLSAVADSDGAGGAAFSFGSTTVSGSTSQGILIGTTTADISFGNTSVTAGSDAISFQNNSAGTRIFGTLSATAGGAGIAFFHGAAGGHITVSGAATLNSTSGNTIDIQNAASGTAINFQSSVSATRANSGGFGANLATNTGATITFNSLTIQTAGGTAALSATGGGTINVTNATGTINNTTQAQTAIVASGVVLNANFATVNSSGGTNGVSLTSVTGTSNFGSGALTGASGTEFLVSAGSPTVTYGGSVTQNNSARVVDVQGATAGTTTFNGTVTGGASSLGVHVGDTSVVNGNVTFTTLILGTSGSRMTNQAVTITGGTGTYSLGAVSIFTNNVSGIVATNADGTLNVTSGTVNSSNATAINIDGPVGLTTLGISLATVTSAGGTANGVSIQDTNGSFTINGTTSDTTLGGDGTGGTISNKSGVDGNNTQGIGVFMSNASNITLRRMTITLTNQNFGIRGINVSNVVVEYCTISGTLGTSVAADEGAIIFDGLTGTSTFTNIAVSGSIEDSLRVRNSSGTANNITITGSTFTNSPNDNIVLEPSGTAVMTAHVTNNAFSGAGGDHLQTATTNSATLNIIFTGNLFAMGSFVGSVLGGVTISGGNAGSSETCNFDISNNGSAGIPLVGTVQGGAININQGNGGGSWQGRVSNNVIGNAGVTNSGCEQCSGIRVENHSQTGTLTALVSNNTIRQWNSGPAINSQSGDAGNATNTGPLNITVTGNVSTNPGVNAQHGFVANMGTAANSTDVSCVDASSNTLNGNAATGGSGIRLRHRNANTVRLPGYAGSQFDTAAVITYANTKNPGSTPASTATTSGLGGGFTNTPGGSPCLQPIVPTAPITSDSTTSEGVRTSVERTSNKQTGQQSRLNDRATTQLISQPIAIKQEVSSISTGRLTIPAKPSKQDLGYRAAYSARDKFISNEVAQQKKKGARITIQPRQAPLVNAGPITIGTLRAGDSVTITFQVIIDNPYAGGPNVSNQGTVSGSNFPDVLTDDPAVGGATDPTLTPVSAPPNINVNDAKVGEPATGSTPMVFTVALTSPAGVAGVQVDFATADQSAGVGHAVAGQDYTATSGTLNFASGEQIKTVSVNVLSDADNTEPDETFLLNLSNAVGGIILDGQAVGTITPTNAAGTFLISEIRTSGPTGAGDDFVELYNNTDSPLTVVASDASAGYGVYKMGGNCNANPVLIGTVPNGTVIPARGHYLLVGSSYSLANYGGSNAAAGNLALTSDIENDRNVAVFTTAAVLAISTATRLDAIGFGANTGGTCDLLREGATAAPVAGSITEHSFSRDECGKGGSASLGLCPASTPVDTNNSSTDFIFADTQGTFIAGVTQRLGAPGPENLSSPIQRNSTIAAFLLDQTKAGAVVPNRLRDAANVGPNANFGTMSIRRRFQNNTGANVTRLRFRIIDISSFPSPGGGVADLRALSSLSVSVSGINDPATCLAGTGLPTTPCTVTVQGTTLETPPSQPNGGAYNSTLSSGTIALATPLAPGASVMVQLLLGVQTTGNFKFYINVEALP